MNNLEKEGYIIIKGKKRLTRSYEIINGQRISIPSKHLKSREVQLTEKGKEIVSEFIISGFPKKINILTDGKVKKIMFVDAVEYLTTNSEVEIRTAVFHLLNQIEKNKSPIDIVRIKRELSKDK